MKEEKKKDLFLVINFTEEMEFLNMQIDSYKQELLNTKAIYEVNTAHWINAKIHHLKHMLRHYQELKNYLADRMLEQENLK